MVYQTYMHMYCPPDPATRDATRLEWDKEKTQHGIIQHEWQRKSQEQAEKEEGWKRETQRHEREMEGRIYEEYKRQEMVRREWAGETKSHEREVEQRVHEEYKRQDKVRQEWARETERHVREFEEMRSHERQEWEREVEERGRREEEERQKLHMYWGHVEAHTCNTYATREYTAQLMNLPTAWKNRVEACKATSLEVHGISHLPTTCEDRGPGVVIGRWEINQQEPDCTTFWDSYDDKYITHKLMNLPEHSDWKEFCATTPAHFNNMQFPGAQECFTSAWRVYGQWEMDDRNC
ncbi:hypothetical protein OG21DRAFT_1489525 [Imleria badia]|nr:hypothetical protein OG21DRAFT_1489525 [Imleria badia]